MLDPTSSFLDPIVLWTFSCLASLEYYLWRPTDLFSLWSLSQQDGEHGDDTEQSTENHFEYFSVRISKLGTLLS